MEALPPLEALYPQDVLPGRLEVALEAPQVVLVDQPAQALGEFAEVGDLVEHARDDREAHPPLEDGLPRPALPDQVVGGGPRRQGHRLLAAEEGGQRDGLVAHRTPLLGRGGSFSMARLTSHWGATSVPSGGRRSAYLVGISWR